MQFSYSTLTVHVIENTCTIMQLSHSIIMWKQGNAINHADSGQELYLVFTLSIGMKKKWDIYEFICGMNVCTKLAGACIS